MEYEDRTPACQRLPQRAERPPTAGCFKREPVQVTKPYCPPSLRKGRIRYEALRRLAAELVPVPV
jgi:hypothetical protein